MIETLYVEPECLNILLSHRSQDEINVLKKLWSNAFLTKLFRMTDKGRLSQLLKPFCPDAATHLRLKHIVAHPFYPDSFLLEVVPSKKDSLDAVEQEEPKEILAKPFGLVVRVSYTHQFDLKGLSDLITELTKDPSPITDEEKITVPWPVYDYLRKGFIAITRATPTTAEDLVEFYRQRPPMKYLTHTPAQEEKSKESSTLLTEEPAEFDFTNAKDIYKRIHTQVYRDTCGDLKSYYLPGAKMFFNAGNYPIALKRIMLCLVLDSEDKTAHELLDQLIRKYYTESSLYTDEIFSKNLLQILCHLRRYDDALTQFNFFVEKNPTAKEKDWVREKEAEIRANITQQMSQSDSSVSERSSPVSDSSAGSDRASPVSAVESEPPSPELAALSPSTTPVPF